MRSYRILVVLILLLLLNGAALAQTRDAAPASIAPGIAFIGMVRSDSDVDGIRTPCQRVRDFFDPSGRANDVSGERPAICDKVLDIALGKAPPTPDAPHVPLRPAGITTDSRRRIVFTEPAARTVHILDFPNRKSIRIEGAKDNRVVFPHGVAVDSEDNIYVTDARLGRIAVFDSDGKFKKFIGEFKGERAFEQPSSIAIDRASGRIYLADTARHFVLIRDRDGHNLASIGKRGGGTGPAEFRLPTDLALHGQELLVLDKLNKRIQVLDLDGHFKREFTPEAIGAGAPKGMAIDSQGQLYLLLDVGLVYVFNPKGEWLFSFGRYGTAAGEFKEPRGIYIDSADRLYISDTGNQRVQIFQITREALSLKSASH